jgi:hypothetical protein
MHYALTQNTVRVPTFAGLAGAGDVVQTTQIEDGSTLQFSVDGAQALISSSPAQLASDTANVLQSTQLFRNVQVGGPLIPFIPGTLNISAIVNGLNDANFLIQAITELVRNNYSFDATTAKLWIQELTGEIAMVPGYAGSSQTPVLHNASSFGYAPLVLAGLGIAAVVVLALVLKSR